MECLTQRTGIREDVLEEVIPALSRAEEREEWRKQPSRQRGLQEKIKKEHSVSGNHKQADAAGG